MLVGVPKEIKDNEFRVGMTPAAIAELVHHGHRAIVEKGAGVGSGSPDEEYARAGAELVDTAGGDLRPRRHGGEGQGAARRGAEAPASRTDPVHLPASRARPAADAGPDGLRRGLHRLRDRDRRARAPAAADPDVGGRRPAGAAGRRPCARKGAGRARRAARRRAGRAGRQRRHPRRRGFRNACRDHRVGMGAAVTVVDRSLEALRRLSAQFGSALRTVYATRASIADLVSERRPRDRGGAAARRRDAKLITRPMLKTMRPGSVIVDIAIDQGGCCETSKPTTHSNPTYVVDGVVHYCVANMPGAVARTSTFALNHATLPFTLALADKGWRARSRTTRTFAPASTCARASSPAPRSPRRTACRGSRRRARWRGGEPQRNGP